MMDTEEARRRAVRLGILMESGPSLPEVRHLSGGDNMQDAVHDLGEALADTAPWRATERALVWVLDGLTAAVDRFTHWLRRS